MKYACNDACNHKTCQVLMKDARGVATSLRGAALLASLGEPTPIPECEVPKSIAAARATFNVRLEKTGGPNAIDVAQNATRTSAQDATRTSALDATSRASAAQRYSSATRYSTSAARTSFSTARDDNYAQNYGALE